jgi:prepilin-type N-terminal cleavage/methylation domain-containing protein
MRRRAGVTLIEVLVAIFIMGIGMLALLTLFPLGAVSMAQALRDDRAASAAVEAENLALAFDIRHDPSVVAGFTTGAAPGPSNPVYADPWGIVNGGGAVPGVSVTIPRTPIAYSSLPGLTPAAAASRFCTLLDDITFSNGAPLANGTANPFTGGTPDLSTGSLQRAGWYTWAYLLQRPNAASDAVVNMSIVVYQKRPLQLQPSEFPYNAAGAVGSNSVTLAWNPATQFQPPIRRNSWLLDTSNLVTGVPHGDFYRVVNATVVTGANQVIVELDKTLKQNTDSMTVMQDVVEVFDKGPGFQP